MTVSRSMLAVAVATLMLITGCTVGPPTAPAVTGSAMESPATESPVTESPTTDDPAATPDEQPSEPAPGERTEDDVSTALENVAAAALGATRYSFEHRVQTGTEEEYVATVITGLVQLDVGRAELAMSFEITDPAYEADLLAATGVETLVGLHLDLVIVGDSEAYMTFPNNANWRGSWLRLDPAAISEVIGQLGLDLDPLAAAGGADGWLAPMLGLLDEPVGFQEGWFEIAVPAATALPFLPGSIARSFSDEGVTDLSSLVPVYVTAEDEWLRTSVWLTTLLVEAAEHAPGLPAPDAGSDLRIDTVVWDLDSRMGVLVPPAASIIDEPPPFS